MTASTTSGAGSISTTDCDVVIVGLGPVGLLSAILLGRQGHRVIGIERWPTPYSLPRAVTFDHEIARTLNIVGIDADADHSINYYDQIYRWVNAEGDTLMEIDWISKAADGWRNRYWFSQPALENRLREIADSLPNVTLLAGNEVTALEQDDEQVVVRFRQTEARDGRASAVEGGMTGSVTGRFLIGSDGANSTVRSLLGLEMVDLNFYYDWLVVDILPDEDKDYDPPHYQVCDPVRPTTIVAGGPGPRPEDPWRRRWEFMALDGEDLTELGTPEKTWELLKPFDVTPENSVLERAVVWRFQAKYLEDWRAGRVALAGDAAHLMPPFAGEGMCAGLRDAVNLTWRLDLALRGLAGPDILEDYTHERKPHAKWYIQFSVDAGAVICVTDPEAAAERDRRMIAEHAEQSKVGPISPHDAVLGPGSWVDDDEYAGKPSMQGRVAYRGRAGRYDEAVGRGWSLISAADDPQPLTPLQREAFEAIGGREISVGAVGTGADAIDIEGAYAAWFSETGCKHLLVRPDFYVAATAVTTEQLRDRFDAVMDTLSLRTPAHA